LVVQVQELETVPVLHDVVTRDLNRLIGSFRLRFGLERLVLFGIRGAIAAAALLVGLAFSVWLTNEARLLWVAALPLLAAPLVAALRWPTRHATAITVDRRFALDERLATAVELSEGSRRSRFKALQLRDTLGRVETTRGTWLVLDARARNEAALALVTLAVAAVAVVFVPRLPRPAVAVPAPTEAVDSELPLAADEPAQRALPLDVSDEALPGPAARPGVPSADLAARVQQEQAERSALDKLAQALSDISAGRPAADAIQQGDFDQAHDQLQNLADNADQLTSAAKQQLAGALQRAAQGSAQADRALADREQQAAQALSRSSYDDQRQALRGLADQVQRSAEKSVPSDQLERDVGQLQQQTSAAAQDASGGALNPGGTAQSGTSQSPSTQGGQLGGNPGDPGAQGAGTVAAGAQNGDGAGQQNGAGVGTGTDPNLYSDQPSRLDTAGQQVQVPLKLGNGPGARPADGTEDQTIPDPRLGGRTISEVSQNQETGQVAPEQNLVPGEQRPVVRGYFR
jgi:hypothetical protein